MKIKKFLESAVLSTTISLSSASMLESESVQAKGLESKPTIENIEYTVIDSKNPLQNIEDLSQATQQKLYNQIVNSRRTLYIQQKDGYKMRSSGNLCVGKDGDIMLVAIEHGVVDDSNRAEFEKMIDDGTAARLTQPSRYIGQKYDDFQFVIPKTKVKQLGITITREFEKTNQMGQNREANVKLAELDKKDSFAANIKNFRKGADLPKCNFAIFADQIPDFKDVGVAQNQWGRVMQTTDANLIGMVQGDSGSPLFGITKSGVTTTFGFYKGMANRDTEQELVMRSDVNLIISPDGRLTNNNTQSKKIHQEILEDGSRGKTTITQYESNEPRMSIP